MKFRRTGDISRELRQPPGPKAEFDFKIRVNEPEGFFQDEKSLFFYCSLEPSKINPGILYLEKPVDLCRAFPGSPEESLR